MKVHNIKVTTTSGFDGVKIEEYLEPITAHVVVGMDFFKDFLSSFSDIFGGKSSAYQNTLSSINEEARCIQGAVDASPCKFESYLGYF